MRWLQINDRWSVAEDQDGVAHWVRRDNALESPHAFVAWCFQYHYTEVVEPFVRPMQYLHRIPSCLWCARVERVCHP